MQYEIVGYEGEFNKDSLEFNPGYEIIPREKTIIIKFTYEDGKKRTRKFGVVNKSEIYNLISEGKEINLNYCYVEDFSLKEYKKKYKDKENNNIDVSGNVYIKKINAYSSFFSDLIFRFSVFEERVDFVGSTFVEKAYFMGSTFKKKTFFRYSTFEGVARFLGSTFKEKAFFRYMTFEGETDFRDSTFEGVACFLGSTFVGKSNFSGTTFEGEADFRGSIFEGEAHFSDSKFKGEAEFSNSKFEGEVHFSGSAFEKEVNLNGDFNVLILNGCLNKTCMDIRASMGAKVKKLEFWNFKNLGNIYIDWSIAEQGIYNRGNTNFIQKANQFQILKENYNKLGQYNEEDRAYLEFKRSERKSKYLGEDVKMLNELSKRIRYVFSRTFTKITNPFKWLVLDFVGHYGTNPWRVLSSMIIAITVFAGIYYVVPLMEFSDGKNIILITSIKTATYYSGITFLTIGYGDLSPANFPTQIISVIEGFIGLFFMSYFTVAFVRKILR